MSSQTSHIFLQSVRYSQKDSRFSDTITKNTGYLATFFLSDLIFTKTDVEYC